MGERYTTIYRTHDPVEAEMVEDVLAQNELHPHLIGTRSAALIGVSQQILALRIEVPEQEAQEARALIEALLGEPQEQDLVEDAATPTEAADDPLPPVARRKSRVIAAGVVSVLPGAAHFYVGRPWTAALLVLLAVTGMVMMIAIEGAVAGATLLVGEICVDLIGGQLGIEAARAGQRSPRYRQLLAGVAAFAAVALIAWQLELAEPSRGPAPLPSLPALPIEPAPPMLPLELEPSPLGGWDAGTAKR